MNDFFKLAVLLLCPFIKMMPAGQTPIKGKVIYTSCATAVIQITDSAFFDLGQEKWQRTPIDKEYGHVFVVKNRCSLLDSRIQREEEFSFFIKEETAKNDCKQCTLFDNLPNVVLNIEPFKKKD